MARRRRGCGPEGDVGGDDEADLLADVVEGQDFVEEEQAGVGDAELIGGGAGSFSIWRTTS